MTASTVGPAAGAVAAGGRSISLGGRRIPVVLPTRRDPRLHLAAVLLTVQVLGQTMLGFKLSIAQILVTMAVCAVIEVTVTLRRTGALVWPASALLTGNSIALLLRATGTDHGDWWSLNGIHWFVLAAVLALGSKYLVRPGGRHLFNPSNVGIVWVLLVVGPSGVFPQYLWWGPWTGLPVVLATTVLVAGAVWVLRQVGMVPMVLAFLATFGALIGLETLVGDGGFYAIWHPVRVTGAFYWMNVVLSPEVLIFVFFMMSDPQTAPRTPPGRVVFGVVTAVVAAALVVVQPTEFGVKLGILASLTFTCALVPLIDAVVRRSSAGVEGTTAPPDVRRRAVLSALRRPAVIAAVIIAVAAPLNTLALADDEQLILLERGLSGDPDPQ